MERIPYASIVGSLMYAQTCTRPNISFAIGILERYQSNPGLDHWKDAKKILRYLQETKDHMLTYKTSDHLEVIRYSDSDFFGCVDTRKSTFDYLFLLAGGVWGLGVVDNIARSLKIYCDNFAVVFFSKNKYSKGAKHLELKYFVVKEEVQK
ncbi:secreted RxLR effector protein 161-like [Elaeis guineensis]|uniref:secreted RxLR effector protein 161-like n=1 Tax=Elaeis guineensis var. tenera TaxID=51953 RepID=UPI003C6D9CC1